MKTKIILFLIFLGAQVSAAPNLESNSVDFPIEINLEEEIKSCPVPYSPDFCSEKSVRAPACESKTAKFVNDLNFLPKYDWDLLPACINKKTQNES